jgi:hypothetical protein
MDPHDYLKIVVAVMPKRMEIEDVGPVSSDTLDRERFLPQTAIATEMARFVEAREDSGQSAPCTYKLSNRPLIEKSGTIRARS